MTDDTATRSPRTGRIAAGLLVGVPVLLLVLATLGALTQESLEGLPVVPWETLWALPLDRWVRDVAASVTLGFLAVGALLLPRPDVRLLRAASLAALVWLVALLCQVPLTVSELLARPWSDSLDPVIVQSLVTQTQLGQYLVAQIGLVALVMVLGWAVLGRGTGVIVLVLALAAAMLPALSGHSGLHAGHTAASVSLAFHLVAVGVWVGGLIAVCAYATRSPDGAALAIRRFSVLALVCVIVLAESGLLNASLRVDGFASLISTQYGTVILAKSTLLAALVVLGWRQRRRVVPIADTPMGRGLLARFAAFEVILMGIALGLSVVLSRTAPPAGAIAGDRMTTGALAVLGLAIPVMLVWAGVRPAWLSRVAGSYPEPFGVLALVSAFVLSTLVPSGLLGIGFAAIIASVLLAAAGWSFAVGAVSPRGVPSVILVMLGWPVVTWWSVHTDPQETWWQVGLSVAVSEVMLVILLVLGRTRSHPVANDVPMQQVSVA